MTLKEFEKKNSKVNPVILYRRIAEDMKCILEMKVRDIHAEPDDPYNYLWQKVTGDWKGETFSDWIDDTSEYIDCYNHYTGRLPYKAENMLYRLSLMANGYLCEECTDDDSPRSVLSRFFNLPLDDYLGFVRKYACESYFHSSYRVSDMGDTIGEIIIKANDYWERGMLSNMDAKEAVIYLLVYPFGLCFFSEEGKKNTDRLLKGLDI